MNSRSKRVVPLLLVAAWTVVIVAGFGFPPAATAATAEVVAVKALAAPVLDGRADDGAWGDARPVVFVAHEDKDKPAEQSNVEVTMRFAYDSTYFYALAQWSDATWSVHKNLWTFDAERHAWTKSGNEDRFAILWDHPLFPIKDFRADGCNVACHGPEEAPPGSPVATEGEKFLSTNSTNEKGDLWHWKAARTAAAGWADDQGVVFNFSGALEAARPSDPKQGSGGPADNKQTLAGVVVPKYFEPAPSDAKDAAFILQAEVSAGEALLIKWVDGTGRLYYEQGGQNKTVPLEARIPGYVLSRMGGSRGDVDAADVHDGSRYTLEMRRALDTGDSNDIAFRELGVYAFAVGVFNDSGGDEHSRSDPRTLQIGSAASTPASGTPTPEGTNTPGVAAIAAAVVLGAAAIAISRRAT